MADAPLPIIIDPHTLARAEERGTGVDEIRDVVANGTPIPARGGRKARAKVYEFDSVWNGRFYLQKRVEVIFVERDDSLITVTVYVFFGRWS